MKIVSGYAVHETSVSEMTRDAADDSSLGINIPIEASLRDDLISEDTEPMFVTVEVLNESVSKNGRYWSKEAIASVMQQINSKHPDGYLGHLSDTERATKYPDPQTVWLGATSKEVGGKLRLFAKGYVLPEAKKLRSYLKTAKKLNKNIAVSVYGTVKQAVKTASGALDMSSFNLESIDWARGGSEGVPNMGYFQVASEMNDGNDINDEGAEVNKIEALQSATVSEMQEHNPTLVSEMTTAAVAELEPVVSEMTATREALGLKEDESVSTRVSEMAEELSTMKLDAELRDKVVSPNARKILRSSVVKEMSANGDLTITQAVDNVLGSEKGKAVLKANAATAPKISPQHDKPSATTRSFSRKIN